VAEDEPSIAPAARPTHTTQRDPAPGTSPELTAPTIRRGVRLLLFLGGGLSILVGLVGLALPIIPQTVPLALGVALLSLASERVYGRLQTLLARWPRIWRTIQAVRHRLERWLSR